MKNSETYNLKMVSPELAAQWHPTKNEILSPEDVPPRAFLHAWWQCPKGHEYIATVSDRSKGAGCPHCKRRGRGVQVTEKYNLAALHPDSAQLWHPTKNAPIKPHEVLPASSRRVWWQCENGHEWVDSIANVRKSPLCSRCYQKKAPKDYNLAVVFPHLAAEWHPTKNGDLDPARITPKGGRIVWWQCAKGHEWKARILHRARGNCNCPYCNKRKPSPEYNLAVVQPGAARMWHPTKNGTLDPTEFTPGSIKNMWWQCEIDKNHEWESTILEMKRRPLCPYCSGIHPSVRNLQVQNPALAKQWHPHKNGGLTPGKVTPHCNQKVWWICDKGHEFQATVGNRNRVKSRGCPFCAGRKKAGDKTL
ncbi:MAG: zinc-ribbon domain-containing protein [bacterium]|nr:zinc-ribbon domain-containing protein [bacterium]